VRSPRRPVLGILLITAAAVLGACTAGGSAGSVAPSASRIAVAVSEAGCAPAAVTVPSGPVTFVVTNTGNETGEFEIVLADTRVIDEVENIVPGFVVNMTIRVDGGTYQMLCGNTQAPKGVLTVIGGTAATPPPNTVVDQAELDAARDKYDAYVKEQTAALVTAIGAFTAAIEAGDVAGAKSLYAAARIPWERIEPVAELFPDLDQAIDFREEDFDGGADDPGFKGFHKIEKGLFEAGTSAGLAPLAAELRANVAELKKRIETLVIDPRVMARGAGELIEEVAQSKMTGEEDRYSKLDLVSIDANVDGSARIVEELRPLLSKLDAPYLAQLDAAGKAVEDVIAKYATSDGEFKPFDQVSADDLKVLQARLADLSELLAELTGRLGLAV
jgi:iron uptake system component EfeO